MALEDSEIADYYKLQYTATRLEDLPRKDTMQKLAKWLNIEYSDSMLRSTWFGLDWHGDRMSNKVFSSTGWTKNRAENGWEHRLGTMDKYILNYIMNSRLKHYLYTAKDTNIIDSFIVFILIVFPFKYERNFFKYHYINDRVRRKKSVHLVFIPVYYLKRVLLCYKYYFRTLRSVKFSRNWIDSNYQNTVTSAND
jgi:hypothetical protein